MIFEILDYRKSAKNTLKGEKTPPFLPKNLHISIKCSTFAAEMVAKQPPYRTFC